MLTREPNKIELVIFKYIFLPIVGIILIWLLVGNTSSRNMCENTCIDKVFFDFKFVPFGKVTLEERCYCFTKENSKNKNISFGVKVGFK